MQSRVGFGTFRKHRQVFEQSHRLIARSSLLAPPETAVHALWPLDPDYLHFALRHGEYNHSHFFRYLTSPRVFQPRCVWALFWALVKSEHQFANKFLPFWSHEERLTGHFISQICERIDEFAVHWSSLAGGDPKRSWLDVWYADTATGSLEKVTGADLGLIVHGQYAGDEEFFKVARFQVKKVPSSNTARIDLNQTKALLQSEGLGHYLFFTGKIAKIGGDHRRSRRPQRLSTISSRPNRHGLNPNQLVRNSAKRIFKTSIIRRSISPLFSRSQLPTRRRFRCLRTLQIRSCSASDGWRCAHASRGYLTRGSGPAD